MTGKGTPAGGGPALERFRRSMVIDYEKWHDGVGYDLDAIAAASPAERAAIERLLLDRGVRDWRDAEALAALDTAGARAALRDALRSEDAEIRLSVTRYAADLVDEAGRADSLVRALETAAPFAGLTEALDQAAVFHPPAVIDALFRAALSREGEVAVHVAALLLFLHGKADELFDMAQRPFLLRFNTDDRGEREAVFRELCARVGVEPESLLAKVRRPRRQVSRQARAAKE